MFLSGQETRINTIIDNHIHVWSAMPSFAPLAQVLREDRHILARKLVPLTERSLPQDQTGRDAVRLFLLRYALERSAGAICADHFTLFREEETVQAILEDSYEVVPGAEFDQILIPHQNEALKIIVQCFFHKVKPADQKDVICYLHLFGRKKEKSNPDQDRTMRFRSMVWYVYLAIDIVLSRVWSA